MRGVLSFSLPSPHRRLDCCVGAAKPVTLKLGYEDFSSRPASKAENSNWQLPACFAELRQVFETRLGPFVAARHYIRILQLLAQHPVKRIQKAIELCLAHSTINADMIINKVNRLAQHPPFVEPTESNIDCYQIQVPKPDLSKFDRLITSKFDQY